MIGILNRRHYHLAVPLSELCSKSLRLAVRHQKFVCNQRYIRAHDLIFVHKLLELWQHSSLKFVVRGMDQNECRTSGSFESNQVNGGPAFCGYDFFEFRSESLVNALHLCR